MDIEINGHLGHDLDTKCPVILQFCFYGFNVAENGINFYVHVDEGEGEDIKFSARLDLTSIELAEELEACAAALRGIRATGVRVQSATPNPKSEIEGEA